MAVKVKSKAKKKAKTTPKAKAKKVLKAKAKKAPKAKAARKAKKARKPVLKVFGQCGERCPHNNDSHRGACYLDAGHTGYHRCSVDQATF